MISRTRPWRSSSAPAMGLIEQSRGDAGEGRRRPPAGGELYRCRANRITTMPTIDWAMRAICIASRTRHSDGTSRSARYEGRVVVGSVMAHERGRPTTGACAQIGRTCGSGRRSGTGRRGTRPAIWVRRGRDALGGTARGYGGAMQLIGGQPVFAATDLVGFLACEHLVGLELAAMAGLVDRPVRLDPEIDLTARRGLEHEARYLAGLEAAGRAVTRIDPGDHDAPASERLGRLVAAAAATEACDPARRRCHLPGNVLRRPVARASRLPSPSATPECPRTVERTRSWTPS